MGLEKAIKSGKEHRKEYRKSKVFDTTCRNHGGCSYCRRNRTHCNDVRATQAHQNEKEVIGMKNSGLKDDELSYLKKQLGPAIREHIAPLLENIHGDLAVCIDYVPDVEPRIRVGRQPGLYSEDDWETI